MQTLIVIHSEYFNNSYYNHVLLFNSNHNYFIIIYYISNKDAIDILEQNNYLDPSQ